MILLQVGYVEPDTRDETFEGVFEGSNDNEYSCCLRTVKGGRGH